MARHTDMVLKVSKINLIIGILSSLGFSIFPIISERIVIQYKLRNFSKELKPTVIKGQIIECIEMHLKLISYIDKVNELVSFISLLDSILFVSLSCIMLLSFTLVDTVLQKFTIAIYITMIFTQTFLFYYFSNEVYYQSLEISTAAYDIDWFNYDVDNQKLLKLFLLRSQKPCANETTNIVFITRQSATEYMTPMEGKGGDLSC
ncbi:odorant receptor 30a-like [Musca autumnalis]|uniref:odorant receptor 30a-like n=1 Tax=Musca autumnalis TaxID=221902 RepID=UPI003CECAEE5